MARAYFIIALLALITPAFPQNLFYQPAPTPQGANSALPASRGRLLVAGDTIDIRVYQEEDLNTRVRIENDGSIAMPLLGVIRVAGKTAEQARDMIHDLLQKSYLQKPEVSLTVVDSAKRRFCIMGEVRQPGYYQMPENERMTLLQAISLAGGYTAFAQPKKISIKRLVGGVETVKVVDAKAMAKNEKVAIVEIEPNDTIMVTDQLF